MHKLTPALVFIWTLVGCHTPSPRPETSLVDSEEPAVPSELRDADATFREYLRLTRLNMIPAEAQQQGDVLRALMRWKANRGTAAIEGFDTALTRNASPDVEELALLRIAQFHLNLACELDELGTPTDMSPEQQEIFADVLTDAAYKLMVDDVRENLDGAAAVGGRRQALVQRLRSKLPKYEGEVAKTCATLRDAWSAPGSSTLDEVARTACEDGEAPLCWVWATYGGGGDDAMQKACDGDVARACVQIADRLIVFGQTQSSASEAGSAEALYARACALGDTNGCRREFAVFVPARRDDYRRECLGDSAVACAKLARTLALDQPDRGLWWPCTSQPVPPPTSTCEGEDAFACAARAMSMSFDQRYGVPLPKLAAPDPAKAALECGEGTTQSCLTAAGAFGESSRVCAGVMLLEACARGETRACGLPVVPAAPLP